MPHIIVKMYPGRTDEQKQKLAESITRAVMDSVGAEERTVSIAVEEVAQEDWDELVYQPDIIGKANTLLKKPGY